MPKTAFAGVTNNALDFYNTYGSDTKLIDGNIYWVSKAQDGSSSGIRIRTIGMQVTSERTGEKIMSSLESGTLISNVGSSTQGNQVYTLFRLNYRNMMISLGLESELWSGTDTEVIFNAIMIRIDNGVLGGSVNADGTYRSGTVAYTFDEAVALASWTPWDLPKQYYNRTFTMKSSDKPELEYPELEWASITGEQYKNGDNYWFKQGNYVTLQNTFHSWSYPLMNVYALLEDGNRQLSIGIDTNNNVWHDNFNTSLFSDGWASHVAGGVNQRHRTCIRPLNDVK